MFGKDDSFGFAGNGPILTTAFSGQRKPVSIGYPTLFVLLLVTLLAVSPSASTDVGSDLNLLNDYPTEQRNLYTSLYTKHFNPDPDHVNDQNMLGFEMNLANDRLVGFAMFDNSFGQDSHYLYLGKTWRAFDSDRWYYKFTGGLLHGYREPYEDKIPFNDLGVAPAVVPGLGYRYKSFFAEYAQLGLSGGLITVGINF